MATVPSEVDTIAATRTPATVRSLTRDICSLGVRAGDALIVHSSLSALGWVAGGAQAVVQSLLDAVGPEGTLVMPTQSGQLSDPAAWSNPPVPSVWVDQLRDELPAFDPYLTPTTGMGQIVECFRQHRSTIRSSHPTDSFAACGQQAAAIVGSQPLVPSMGDDSPLGRLYDLDARVLLLGVNHRNNTSLHLAEHRAIWPSKAPCRLGAPIAINGRRTWVTYNDLALDESDFAIIGEAFAATGREHTGTVGTGTGRLSSQRALVDFAVRWMTGHRR